MMIAIRNMTRAVDLLRNKFGVSQHKHDIKQDDEIILTVYWHPLTIAEREAIQRKVIQMILMIMLYR